MLALTVNFWKTIVLLVSNVQSTMFSPTINFYEKVMIQISNARVHIVRFDN